MRRIILISLFCVIMVSLRPPATIAGGFGLYVESYMNSDLSGNPQSDWDVTYDKKSGLYITTTQHAMKVQNRDFKVVRSVGLVYDTGVGVEKMISYRVNLDYQNFSTQAPVNNIIHFGIDGKTNKDHNYFDYKLKKFKMESIGLNQTFKLNFAKIGPAQLWFGPQLRLAYTWGKSSEGVYMRLNWNKSAGTFDEKPGKLDPTYNKYGVQFYDIGIAPVLGLNLNVGNFMTPSVSIGYRWLKSYYGSGRERFRDWTDTKIGAKENSLFVNFALMFNIGQ